MTAFSAPAQDEWQRLAGVLHATVHARKGEIIRTAYGEQIIRDVDSLMEHGWWANDMARFENLVIGSLRAERENGRTRALLAVWMAYANWNAAA